MAILFTIYTLQFAANSATYGYGIYADVKSESVVFRILKAEFQGLCKRKFNNYVISTYYVDTSYIPICFISICS